MRAGRLYEQLQERNLGIAIAIFYLPALAFLCWLSGFIAQRLVVKSQDAKVLAHWKHYVYFGLGALLSTTACAITAYLLNGNNEWEVLFERIATSLLAPPILGTALSLLSISLAKTESVSSVSLNRFALGIYQGIWLIPAIGLVYSTRGLFTSGIVLAFVPVVVGVVFGVAALAALSLRPIFRVKHSQGRANHTSFGH